MWWAIGRNKACPHNAIYSPPPGRPDPAPSPLLYVSNLIPAFPEQWISLAFKRPDHRPDPAAARSANAVRQGPIYCA
jgi:hypothetical protein